MSTSICRMCSTTSHRSLVPPAASCGAALVAVSEKSKILDGSMQASLSSWNKRWGRIVTGDSGGVRSSPPTPLPTSPPRPSLRIGSKPIIVISDPVVSSFPLGLFFFLLLRFGAPGHFLMRSSSRITFSGGGDEHRDEDMWLVSSNSEV